MLIDFHIHPFTFISTMVVDFRQPSNLSNKEIGELYAFTCFTNGRRLYFDLTLA
jgi:hypothetical protein